MVKKPYIETYDLLNKKVSRLTRLDLAKKEGHDYYFVYVENKFYSTIFQDLFHKQKILKLCHYIGPI